MDNIKAPDFLSRNGAELLHSLVSYYFYANLPSFMHRVGFGVVSREHFLQDTLETRSTAPRINWKSNADSKITQWE